MKFSEKFGLVLTALWAVPIIISIAMILMPGRDHALGFAIMIATVATRTSSNIIVDAFVATMFLMSKNEKKEEFVDPNDVKDDNDDDQKPSL